MRLEETQDGDRALLNMERYVDEGTKSYSPFAARSEVTPCYQPRSELPHFELETVWVPRSRVTLYEAEPATSLRELYVRRDEVRFAVHPETWARDEREDIEQLRALPRGEPIRVAPTASTRTVLVVEPGMPSHFLKLHCPRRISRFNRELRRKNVHNSVAVTRDIMKLARDHEWFGYLRDAFGVTFGSDDRAWGFVVRERLPKPPGSGVLIPCFALFGGDLHRPSDPPLMVQLIERLHADPTTLLLEAIMVPVVECWALVARQRGILLESHAQNTLLELGETFQPHRIVHRDFDVWIDREARCDLGLEIPFLDAQVGADSGRARAPYYSLVYDRFVGHEFFDYLLDAVARFHAIERDMIRDRVSKIFRRAFPDASKRFPTHTMFYFSDAAQPGDHFALVDLNRAPEWR